MAKKHDETGDIVIKKYANRRLYDTSTSQYVTLDYVRQLVKNGTEFTVVDAKSGEDLTHSVLSQIIFEEESRGENLLPLPFLRQLIKYYGDSLQSVVPSYLQVTMDAFTQQQDQMREQFADSMHSPQAVMKAFQDQSRRNMEMFGQAMQMFNPFMANPNAAQANESKESNGEGEDIDSLRAELNAMKAKLDKLDKG